ncbi:MAG: DNA repair protein RecN [Clostridia bacterium]
MLINLSINNVAVIEKAEVEFSKGFNILTGETGAGKSILIDALSMVLGMRTSRDLIRTGAQFALVSAIFSQCPDLSDFDIEPEEDGNLFLYRKLSSDGKNVCKINSSTVPLSTLKAVGERLVTIHGQNDNIALLKPSYHLSILDAYAKDSNLLEEYKNAFISSSQAFEKLEKMRISESDMEMQKDTLSFRINEIRQVEPVIGEDEELAQKRDVLRNYSSILAALDAASNALSSQGGAKDCLYGAMHSMETASSMDKSLGTISEKLTDAYYCVEDIASEIISFASRMTFSPSDLDVIEERLDKITRLKKKYGPEISDCLENLSKWEKELEELVFYDDNIAQLEKEATECERKMLELGEKLHKVRVDAGTALTKAIESELAFLDMPKVRFDIEYTSHSPGETGLYSAEFLISTNPSENLKPLSRIASGGEMSRIMLALKSVLSNCDDVNVLLFDEIDTGVSGRAASRIAQKLKTLACDKQVICVSHLPQMAARAHNHLTVTKDTSSDSFRAVVTTLDFDGRVEELSRLISSDNITPATREAAREMLEETN